MKKKEQRNSTFLNESVLIWKQCGTYNTNKGEDMQTCSCKTLLKYNGIINESVLEIKKYKICYFVAHQKIKI
jgi:hypothetical protein